jgi:hypothetical protein
MFQRNISSPYSGLKSKRSKKQAWRRLWADLEDGGSIFLQTVWLSPHCPALYPRRQNYSNLNLKSSIFWGIMPCSPLKVHHFRACRLHLHGWRVSKPSKKLCLLPASCWFLAWLTFQPWRWRQHVPLKCWLTFNELHSIISQKTELFITLLWEPQILQN